jgi:hypothetical protein
MSVKCVQCGFVSFATAELCKRCGISLVKPASSTERERERKQRRYPTSAHQIAWIVGISGAVLLGVVLVLGAVHLTKGRLTAQATLPTAEEIAPADLRARFADEIKHQTDELATDLFVLCRDAEKQRLDRAADRLSKVMRENDEDVTKSQADKFRTLISLKPEVSGLQDEMDALREVSPTKINPQLAGPDSDILFYDVTGGLARNVSQRFVQWWEERSADQQKMAEDLRRLGFKAVIIGNSTADSQHLDLGK